MPLQTDDQIWRGDIQPGEAGAIDWQQQDPNASIARLLAYVEREADKAAAWYWRNKRWKATCSRLIQISALVLTALAGIFPVAVYLFKDSKWINSVNSGLWSSLFVGIAAALIGLDRTFGLSSGWTRYVLTATSIRRLLEEFRMDCVLLLCQTGQRATPEYAARVVQRAKEFRLAVENTILQETKDWATEFQNSVAQVEKDAKAQVEALRNQLEKNKQGEAATEAGSVELSLLNLQKADAGTCHVMVTGRAGKVADETLEGEDKWVYVGVEPGQYKLMIQAEVGGKPVRTSLAMVVRPGEISRAELSLPG